MANLLVEIKNVVHNYAPHHLGDVISGTCTLVHTNTENYDQQSIGAFNFDINKVGDPWTWEYIPGIGNVLMPPDPVKRATITPAAINVPANSSVDQDNVPFSIAITGSQFNFVEQYDTDMHSVDYDYVEWMGELRLWWRAWHYATEPSFFLKITAQDDMSDQFSAIVLDGGKTDWRTDQAWVNGTFTIRHTNPYSDNDAYSTCGWRVDVYNSSNVLVRTSPVVAFGQQQYLLPSEQKNETGVVWGIDCSNLPVATGYYIKIRKEADGNIIATGPTFNIIATPSSVKDIFWFRLDTYYHPELPESIYGTIDNQAATININVPSTFDKSHVHLWFAIDAAATSNPGWNPDITPPQDCTNPLNIRVTAGDQTYRDYTLTIDANAPADTHVVDDGTTRVVPGDISMYEYITCYANVKNLGSLPSSGTEKVLVFLSDLARSWNVQIGEITVPVINGFASAEIQMEPYMVQQYIGTYYIDFYLNGATVSKTFMVTTEPEPPENPDIGDFSNLYMNIAYAAGPYHKGDLFTGTFDISHSNVGNPDPAISTAKFYVYLIDKNNVTRAISSVHQGAEISLDPDEDYIEEDVPFSISLAGIDPDVDFWIKIVRQYPTDLFINGAQFDIEIIQSTEKKILQYGFLQASNPLLPANIWGIVDHDNLRVDIEVPFGTNVSALVPFISVSESATVLPASGTAQDYSDPQPSVTHTVTAQNLSTNDYDVYLTFDATPPYLFIYDNEFTRISPDELEREQVVKFFVLISNSGEVESSQGTLTVRFHDSADIYVDDLTPITIPPLDYNEDYLVEGEYEIPADVPLGVSIDYMLTFHLNNSTIDRHLKVSHWEIASKTIVFNKDIGAFVRESVVTSKMYCRINKNFYSLQPLSDFNFFFHTDQLVDGEVKLYDQEFEPSITFVINKFGLEKVFDNIIAQLNPVGVKQIEYWTETQYAKHVWPVVPLSQTQLRPWIDPEYREDKWYFPVHNEMIFREYLTLGTQVNQGTVVVASAISSDIPAAGTIEINGVEYKYLSFTGSTFTLEFTTGRTITSGSIVKVLGDDSVDTRSMRGTYLKIKITFKSLYKFTLKHIITEFRQSNI